MTEALRYNSGKPRFDLVPPEFEVALADLFRRNTDKYPGRNWEKGMDWGKCYSSLRDHLAWWMLGQDYDEESGTHHMVMAAWNAMALYCYHARGIGKDTRSSAFDNLPKHDSINLMRGFLVPVVSAAPDADSPKVPKDASAQDRPSERRVPRPLSDAEYDQALESHNEELQMLLSSVENSLALIRAHLQAELPLHLSNDLSKQADQDDAH